MSLLKRFKQNAICWLPEYIFRRILQIFFASGLKSFLEITLALFLCGTAFGGYGSPEPYDEEWESTAIDPPGVVLIVSLIIAIIIAVNCNREEGSGVGSFIFYVLFAFGIIVIPLQILFMILGVG